MSTAAGGAGPRASRRLQLLATAMFAFYAVGMATTMALRVAAHEHVWDTLFITFLTFSLVGWLIAMRSPRTVIGWLFLSVGVLTAFGVMTEALVALALHRGWAAHGVVLFSAWVQMWYWYPLLLMATVYTLLLFPSGLPSRRWRPVLWALTIALAAMTVTAALSPAIDFGKGKVPNPIGLSSDWKDVETSPVFNVSGFVLMACVVATVVSLGVRFRRSRGIERAQMKWFFLGAAFLAVDMIVSLLSKSFNNSWVNEALAPFAFMAMPVSCGFAILRYRLYDIDRIVSRAVSYLVVTGLVVAFYVGVIALVETGLGFSSSVAVAATTLAAAAVFQPLRRRVQSAVDHRFDRAAYDARRTVERFSAAMRDKVDVDAVRDDLLSTATLAVAPAFASLWVVGA
ncbi:MAG TPA: histidine kinase N-terminal 7TM domain-containing protein [Mycobacteriales bacterium]|nr:histidine kinase N-terminal 7TM domain-containing protein [Mycobacteriales bacterium]